MYSPWIKIGKLNVRNPTLYKTKFKSWGDW